MGSLPAETRALRRVLLCGVVGFAAGCLGAAAVLTWLLVVYLPPGAGWWSLVHALVNLVWVAALCGLCVAAGLIRLVERFHYRLGVYRCWHCGRTLEGWREPCPCFAGDPDHVAWIERLARRPKMDRFRHVRRRVRFVLLVNAMLVPVAAWVALSRPSKEPPLIDILVCHACASALLAVIGKALIEVLVLTKRGRRFRLSFGIVVRMLAVWPLTFAAMMVVRELTG